MGRFVNLTTIDQQEISMKLNNKLKCDTDEQGRYKGVTFFCEVIYLDKMISPVVHTVQLYET